MFTGTVDVQYPTNTNGNTSGDVRNPHVHLGFGENCWNFAAVLEKTVTAAERKKTWEPTA